MLFKKPAFLFLLICSIFLLSCSMSNHSEKGVEAAMKHYDHLILNLNADSISMLYTPDGNLGDIAIGRDSIRKFLSSFKNIQVLSQSSATDLIQLIGDTAIQNGSYFQTDIISGKDTAKVKGTYIARWQWQKKEGWLIKKMTTKPSE